MRRLRKAARTTLLTAAIAPVLLASCRDHECARFYMPPNQTQDLPSPDSSLVLTVPRWEDPDGNTFWRVTIADTSGTVLYVDSLSEYVGNLNVYWSWDGDGRVWLYNSDDGMVHFYSPGAGGWEHAVYGPAGEPRVPGLPDPPAGLFPGYVDVRMKQ
jgi:hypothetical protein